MRELAPGLWHWQAAHPEWRSSGPWDQNVSSYALDDGERLLFFDPIAPPSDLEEVAERDAAVVLTAPWHERDMQGLVERHDMPVLRASARYRRGPHADVRHHRRAGGGRQPRPRLAPIRAPGQLAPLRGR